MIQQKQIINPTIICGIDEAGRGAFAGPLVAAAVVLSTDIEKRLRRSKLRIKDGKLLKPAERRKIYHRIKAYGAQIAIEIISARKINNRGIARANRESIRKLIKQIEADEYIIDGNIKLGRINGKTHKIKTIVDADAKILPTILAGIVAKVERDKLMHKLHKDYPTYGWRKNAGYGTKKHVKVIRTLGLTRFHRGIFVTTALRKLAY